MADQEYQIRLSYAKCSMGTMDNLINIKKDHGVVWEKGDDMYPVLNANDFQPKDNIVHFGRCNSTANPGNSAIRPFSWARRLFSKLFGCFSGCDGCKCEPVTLTPWIDTSDGHFVEGTPALTNESICTCYYGGTIRFLTTEELIAKQEEQEKEAGKK